MKAVPYIIISLLLAGCAGPGTVVKIPIVMPDGQRGTIVAHNQQVPDYLLATNKRALNFIIKGDVSDAVLKDVAAAEGACRLFTKTVHPNDLVAVALSGSIYAATGFLGVGVGSQAFSGASFLEYGGYGAGATGMGGIANGIISLGGKTYTFENCGRETLSLFSKYEMHVLQKSPY